MVEPPYLCPLHYEVLEFRRTLGLTRRDDILLYLGTVILTVVSILLGCLLFGVV